jgi:hypothetical protein
MERENLNMDDITGARRKSIAETIKPMSNEALKALGEELFPNHDHPWREMFFTFINENAGAAFYHGTTNDRVHIVYCHTKERGIWFLPGSGKGPLQPKGLGILKEIVERKR